MNVAVCPSCGADVNVKGTPKIGLQVTCKSCDTELEVVWLDPLELDWPMDEYEGEMEDELDTFYDEE
ncbi:MAG: lysine biosynthesis protein LysW [Anaerolineales bacterium]